MRDIFGAMGGFAAILIYFVVAIGSLYWLWVAVQVGSFAMFVIGVLPISFPITAPVGAWMMFFGPPDWVYSVFG